MADHLRTESAGDIGRAVARSVIDDEDVRRHPRDRRRDLADDGGQALRFIERGDAHEHAVPLLPAGRLQLRRGQRPDEATDPLIRPVGAAQRVEDQEEPDGGRDHQQGHEPAEGLAFEPEDVLDRTNEIRRDRDRSQPRPDDEQ